MFAPLTLVRFRHPVLPLPYSEPTITGPLVTVKQELPGNSRLACTAYTVPVMFELPLPWRLSPEVL